MNPLTALRPTVDLVALTAAEDALRAGLDAVAAQRRRIEVLQTEEAMLIAALGPMVEAVEVAGGSTGSQAREFAIRSLIAELALALRTTEYAADRLRAEANVLVHRVPGVLGAVRDGRISGRASRDVVEQCQRLEQSLLAERGEAERALTARPWTDEQIVRRVAEFADAAVPIAQSAPPARLRTRLIALRERFHLLPMVQRHASARTERRVSIEDVEDGMSWLHAYLPSPEAHALHHRLVDVARAAADFDAEAGVTDPRTQMQRRADLLVDFIAGDFLHDGALPGATPEERQERRVARGFDLGRFAGVRPTVAVTVPVAALLGQDTEEAALLDGVVPIDPDTARQLVANTPSLYRILTDPHTGARLDLSRERYAVSTELRMWLRLRDETCRFPGCGRLAKGCDVDHTIDWQHGGETRADNLAHLCRRHHTLKHQTAWAPVQTPDGAITWRSPSGAVHTTRPAQPFARAG
ncbi:MAG: DUF222 domain-containing protein [Microbacteriaceae bacterium]|nr:DUF222 domain-containing protein [Microbacteriaceae bacterium]